MIGVLQYLHGVTDANANAAWVISSAIIMPSFMFQTCFKFSIFRSGVLVSLLKKVIEGRLQGKKIPGRPRTMLLDALTTQEDEENEINYAKLKEKAQDREAWRQWERGPARTLTEWINETPGLF